MKVKAVHKPMQYILCTHPQSSYFLLTELPTLQQIQQTSMKFFPPVTCLATSKPKQTFPIYKTLINCSHIPLCSLVNLFKPITVNATTAGWQLVIHFKYCITCI